MTKSPNSFVTRTVQTEENESRRVVGIFLQDFPGRPLLNTGSLSFFLQHVLK